MNAVLRPAPLPQFRPMRVTDLPAVMTIENQAYSHPWTGANFIDSLAAGYLAELMLRTDGELLGYFVLLPGFEESHLLNLTVAPMHQRAGHGSLLMHRLLDLARRRTDQALWLEVRPSNHPARALYQRFGFVQVGVRRNYYPAARGQREDALVLRHSLGHEPTHLADPDALV